VNWIECPHCSEILDLDMAYDECPCCGEVLGWPTSTMGFDSYFDTDVEDESG